MPKVQAFLGEIHLFLSIQTKLVKFFILSAKLLVRLLPTQPYSSTVPAACLLCWCKLSLWASLPASCRPAKLYAFGVKVLHFYCTSQTNFPYIFYKFTHFCFSCSPNICGSCNSDSRNLLTQTWQLCSWFF